MLVFKKLFDANPKRLVSLVLASAFCIMLILPSKAEAGILDNIWNYVKDIRNRVIAIATKVTTVDSKVQNVVGRVSGAADKISDGKVENLIEDMLIMLQAAVESQQDGIAAFMDNGDCIAGDGTPCGDFRADLIDLVHIARELNNQILSLHNIQGLNIQIQDLGLADLIEKLPGRVLLPLYKVVTKTQLLTPELINAMENAGNDIDELKTVLFIEDAPEFPSALQRCQFVDSNSQVFKISANSIKGVGLVLKVLGKLFEALGKSPAGGPNEIDAGIHGYVHATVKTNTLGTIGKILGGISEPMSSVSSFVSNKVSSCGDMVRDELVKVNQETMLANQDAILAGLGGLSGGECANPDQEIKENQLLIIEQQEAILRGQRETLCAYKNNLPEQCAEFVGNGYDNHGVGK